MLLVKQRFKIYIFPELRQTLYSQKANTLGLMGIQGQFKLGQNANSQGYCNNDIFSCSLLYLVRSLRRSICCQIQQQCFAIILSFLKSVYFFMQGPPIFETETSECEYVFNWQTPSACALTREAGDNCQVTDRQYMTTSTVCHHWWTVHSRLKSRMELFTLVSVPRQHHVKTKTPRLV